MLVFSFLYFLHFQLGYPSVWKSRIRRSAGCLIFSSLHFFIPVLFCIFNYDVLVFGRAESGGQEGA